MSTGRPVLIEITQGRRESFMRVLLLMLSVEPRAFGGSLKGRGRFQTVPDKSDCLRLASAGRGSATVTQRLPTGDRQSLSGGPSYLRSLSFFVIA